MNEVKIQLDFQEHIGTVSNFKIPKYSYTLGMHWWFQDHQMQHLKGMTDTVKHLFIIQRIHAWSLHSLGEYRSKTAIKPEIEFISAWAQYISKISLLHSISIPGYILFQRRGLFFKIQSYIEIRTGRQAEILPLLVHSPGEHNGQSWAFLKPRVRSFFQVTHVGKGPKDSSYPPLLPQAIKQVAGLEVEQLVQIGVHMGC